MKARCKCILSLLAVIAMITALVPPGVFALDGFGYLPNCWNDAVRDDGNGGDNGNVDGDSSGCNARGFEPINFFNGNFEYSSTDIFIPGRGFPLEIRRYYNIQDPYEGPFGRGWSHNYDIRLVVVSDSEGTYVIRRNNDGSEHVFRQVSDTDFATESVDCYDVLKKYNVWPDALQVIAPPGVTGGYSIREKHGTQYLFDAEGMLRIIADRNNNKLILEYDNSGRLITVKDPVNRMLSFGYENNRIIQISDFSGRKYIYSYNAQGNLASSTLPPTDEYPAGSATSYVYDENDRLTSVVDGEGNEYVTNTYDANNRVVDQQYGQGKYHLSYDYLKTITADANGIITEYYFNLNGTTQKKITYSPLQKIGDANFYTTLYAYNEHKELTRTIYPSGNVVELEYDAKGNVERIIRKPTLISEIDACLVTQMTYEPNYFMLKTITDPKGNTTTFDYDGHGNLLKITYPEVAGQAPAAEFTYNGYGQLETVTDPNQHTTKYVYDADTGYMTKVIRNFGTIMPLSGDSANYAETEFGYDSVGNVTSITDSLNRTTYFEYDALNQLTKTIAPAPYAYETRFTYDRNGNLVQLLKQSNSAKTEWQKVEYAYDARDQLTAIKQYYDIDKYITTGFFYDDNGNRIAVVDGEGKYASYEYDIRNLLTQVIDAKGNVTNYSYDKNGNLIGVSDAADNTTIYRYDNFDRLIRTEYPDASSVGISYDKNSNVVSRQLRNAHVINYTYDALNRLTAKTYNDATSVSYGYDLGSRLTLVQNPAATMAFEYNGLNRIVQASTTVSGHTYVVGYGSDALGNKTKLTYPDTNYVTYTYDALNRLTAVKDAANNAIAAYTYDILSRRTRKDNLNATSAVYQYDDLNRLTGLQTPVESLHYTYDNVGNRRTKTDRFGTHTYAYDDIYQLTGVDYPDAASFQDTTFVYDKVGNRDMITAAVGTSYETNNLNQYVLIDSTDLAYDENGNLTTDTVTSASGANTYVYDDENRLISATTADNIIEYQYDGFGRRVSKKIYNTQYALLTTQYYVYDGDQVIAEYDGSGTLERKYVYGPGIDEPIQVTSHTSQVTGTFYYHSDGLGSIIGLTDASGSLVESYEYDVYGNTVIRGPDNEQRAASSYGNRFGFTGREFDAETGLYYYRARMYSPQLGRFLQIDPIGYYDSMNLYQYCGNNPGNYTDPYGLWGAWFGDFHVGNDRPWFVFNTESWFDIEKGAYATIDGIIPFFDPFADRYSSTDKCGNKKVDDSFQWSRKLGAAGRDLLLEALFLQWTGFRGPEYGRWKDSGVWKEGWHFHWGRGSGLDKHHLPQQAWRWWRNFKGMGR